MASLALSRSSSLPCIRTGRLGAFRILCRLLVAGFSRCLIFDPEDGSGTFFRNACGRYPTTRRYNAEDDTLHSRRGKTQIQQRKV
jgi:hypothetical protein